MQDLGQHCRRGRLACFLAQWRVRRQSEAGFRHEARLYSDKNALVGRPLGIACFGKMMACPAAAIVWGATLWSDLSMQCPESDRARTGGKAWRCAHNVTSSEVMAFYTPSSFSLLYAGSLRRLNAC